MINIKELVSSYSVVNLFCLQRLNLKPSIIVCVIKLFYDYSHITYPVVKKTCIVLRVSVLKKKINFMLFLL